MTDANSRYRSAVFGLLISVLLIGCMHSAYQPPTLPANLEWRRVQVGLCEDYPESTRSPEKARSDLRFLQSNHIFYLRTAIAWDALEPQPGKYNWEFLDDFVRAAEGAGIKLIPYIAYTPEWAARSTNAHWTQPPRNLTDYANIVKLLASRYRTIHSWEIWNEPDNPEFFAGSVQDYIDLFKAGSQAVHEANPSAKVVSGGLAWDTGFLQAFLSTPSIPPAVDVINLHNYYETWSSDLVEDIDRYVNRANRIMIDADANRPIWLAELGYSSFRTNHQISPSYKATYPYEHTASFQGITLFRMLVPLLTSTRVDLVAWYRLHDLPPATGVIGDVNNRHLGIIDTNGVAKPALDSVRFFQRLFQGGFVPAQDAVRVMRSLDSRIETHAFITPGGLVIVAWLKVVDLESPPPVFPKRDDQAHESLNLFIPKPIRKTGIIYDVAGRKAGFLTSNESLLIKGGDLKIVVFGWKQNGGPNHP